MFAFSSCFFFPLSSPSRRPCTVYLLLRLHLPVGSFSFELNVSFFVFLVLNVKGKVINFTMYVNTTVCYSSYLFFFLLPLDVKSVSLQLLLDYVNAPGVWHDYACVFTELCHCNSAELRSWVSFATTENQTMFVFPIEN